MNRLTRLLKRALAALVWLVAAALIALGGAGIVAAMNFPPGTDARAELTWNADQEAKAALDEATDRLADVSAAVEALGTSARDALAAVASGDVDTVNAAVAEGTTQLAAVEAANEALAAAIERVPGVGADSALRISPAVQDRYDGLAVTTSFTETLRDDWATFTGRALDAANLSSLLARHDQETAAAAQQGAQERYPQALEGLQASAATITLITAVRDRLAATTDVSTLSEWIARSEGYDEALRNLYQVLIDADGKVTNKVRAAFDAEQAARKRLPPDTRPIVVIMADVAQGGMNQAVISIEETRASLSEALDIQRQLQEDVEIALPE